MQSPAPCSCPLLPKHWCTAPQGSSRGTNSPRHPETDSCLRMVKTQDWAHLQEFFLLNPREVATAVEPTANYTSASWAGAAQLIRKRSASWAALALHWETGLDMVACHANTRQHNQQGWSWAVWGHLVPWHWGGVETWCMQYDCCSCLCFGARDDVAAIMNGWDKIELRH